MVAELQSLKRAKSCAVQGSAPELQCGLDWTQLFPLRMFVRAGMRIAEMFLDKDALFCYVTNREADGEAEVTLEDAHAVTSAPLVKACRSCHDIQICPGVKNGAAVILGGQDWLASQAEGTPSALPQIQN